MVDDHLFFGRCVGGPLDGTEVAVRTWAGFLATDRAARKAWMYVQQPDGTFTPCTDHDDSLDYPQGAATGERVLDADRLWAAGVASSIDIIPVGD